MSPPPSGPLVPSVAALMLSQSKERATVFYYCYARRAVVLLELFQLCWATKSVGRLCRRRRAATTHRRRHCLQQRASGGPVSGPPDAGPFPVCVDERAPRRAPASSSSPIRNHQTWYPVEFAPIERDKCRSSATRLCRNQHIIRPIGVPVAARVARISPASAASSASNVMIETGSARKSSSTIRLRSARALRATP